MAKDSGIIGVKGAGFKWNAQSLCGIMMMWVSVEGARASCVLGAFSTPHALTM